MTNQQQPITPTPELVQEWWESTIPNLPHTDVKTQLCIQAARWGADQELEACVEWLGDAPVVYNDNGDLHPGSYLRDARRSPSLKEQALALLDKAENPSWDINDFSIVRQALETLPND